MGACCIVFDIDGMLFEFFYEFLNIVPLHLLVKWEVVSPNSREGQLGTISIISSIPWF